MKTALFFACALVITVAWAQSPQLPSVSRQVRELVKAVSADRMRANVEKLVSFGTRHTLSDTSSSMRGIGAARRWIRDEFERVCSESDGRMTVELMRVPIAPSARVPQRAELTNVVATLRPEDPNPTPARILIAGGHYDSRATEILDITGDAPGANDDGSGTAVVLELARVMAKARVRTTVKFVAFAGEEQGLLGATALAERAKREGWEVVGMLNNDIVGSIRSGDGTTEGSYVRIFSEAFSPVDTGRSFKMRNSLGLENDGASRSLARYVSWASVSAQPQFGVRLIYRLDRFLRGGDHAPFHQQGFAAVRLSVVKENYDWQHQNLRTEGGREFGDLAKFMDFEYCASVARANLAALASLALAPAAVQHAVVSTTGLGYGTQLSWSKSDSKTVTGYLVWFRETIEPVWKGAYFVSDTTFSTALSKDDYLFGVSCVDAEGNSSLPVVPTPEFAPRR